LDTAKAIEVGEPLSASFIKEARASNSQGLALQAIARVEKPSSSILASD
jgi:hypothetical protein